MSKTVRGALSVRYQQALRRHLSGKPLKGGYSAVSLGQAALARGLATVDLAIIHERAIVALAPTFNFISAHGRSLKRAGSFFAQMLVPYEEARLATRASNQALEERNQTLQRHSQALARGNRELLREIKRREAGEAVIRDNKERFRTLFIESQAMQKKLRLLTRKVISAQEEERKMISRELHDQVVQTLVGINVELTALGRSQTINAKALKGKIKFSQRLVEKSVKAVHRFARELRPAVLDDLGLIPALLAFSKSLAARKNLRIKITAFSGVEQMAGSKRTVLFRVAQEALTNVGRHAQATTVRINIREDAGMVRMEISDNGRSFPVQKIFLARNPRRLGLVGMKERLEMVGGALDIQSVPGTGTTVQAQIPFRTVPPSP